MNNSDLNLLLKILNKDMKALKTVFQESILSFNDNESTYIIDFSLFKDLTKKHCFKGKTKTVYRHTSIIPPETESKLIPVTIIPIPENRLELFREIVLENFDEKWTFSLSYIYGSHSQIYHIEDLYYRFFYAFCNETFFQENNIENVFENLIKQFNRAIEEQRMKVDIYLPLDSINIIGGGILEIEEKFKIMNKAFILLDKTETGIGESRFYNTIISSRIKLLTKIYTSDDSSDPSYKNDYDKYEKQYQEKLKELHLLTNALYISGFNFKWRSPVIGLPWWFDPKLFKFQNFERKYRPVDKFLKKENIENISSLYLNLKRTQILEKDRVILNSFYRLFQHGLIDAYYIIDASTFLEAMFTKGSNDYVNLRLRLNASSILAKVRYKFWKIYKFLGKIYSIRSRIVHGSDWTAEFETFIRNRYCVNEGSITPAVIKFRDELFKYLQSSLIYLIDNLKEDPELFVKMNSDPLYFFNNSNLTKEEKNRKIIIQKIKNNYQNQRYGYEDKWKELCALFNIEEVD